MGRGRVKTHCTGKLEQFYSSLVALNGTPSTKNTFFRGVFRTRLLQISARRRLHTASVESGHDVRAEQQSLQACQAPSPRLKLSLEPAHGLWVEAHGQEHPALGVGIARGHPAVFVEPGEGLAL